MHPRPHSLHSPRRVRGRAVTYVETRMNVWEALAGRAPGEPAGPADPGVWTAVAERLNPARARPVLRAGIEAVQLTSVRGAEYVMLRSPDDGGRACYLRLTPEEWQLAATDGRHPHGGPAGRRVRPHRRPARAGPGAPGGRRPGRQPDARGAAGRRVPPAAAACTAGPWPVRLGRGLLAVRAGPADGARRHRPAHRLRCTGPAAGCSSPGPPRSLLRRRGARPGSVLFGCARGARGSQSVFLTGGSYAAGRGRAPARPQRAGAGLPRARPRAGHQARRPAGAGRRVPGLLRHPVGVRGHHRRVDGRPAGPACCTTAAGPATGLVLAGASRSWSGWR